MIRISTRMSLMDTEKKLKGAWWQAGMQLFLRLSSWIVFPVIISIFFGRFLDRAFGTEPWLFLLSVSSTFIFSIVMIVRIGLKEMTASEKAEETRNKKQ